MKKLLLIVLKIGISLAILGLLVRQAWQNQAITNLWQQPKDWLLLALATVLCSSAVLLTMDLLFLRAPVAEACADKILQATGLKRHQLLFNASHTHAGPAVGLTADLDEVRKVVAEYQEKVIKVYWIVPQPDLDLWGLDFSPAMIHRARRQQRQQRRGRYRQHGHRGWRGFGRQW